MGSTLVGSTFVKVNLWWGQPGGVNLGGVNLGGGNFGGDNLAVPG